MRFLLVGLIFFTIGTVAWAEDQTSTNLISPKEFKALTIKAKTGDPDAEFILGRCYFNGLGVAQNKPEALKWFEKAAEQGIVEAEMMVGISYWTGVDVKMDAAKGVKWFRKAADQGEPGGFHYLGAAYYLGRGVKQDYVQSYKWTLLFMHSGRSCIPDDAASINAQAVDLEGKMTAKQIEEGRRLAEKAEANLSKMPRFSQGP
jgi:TPR repeat protein